MHSKLGATSAEYLLRKLMVFLGSAHSVQEFLMPLRRFAVVHVNGTIDDITARSTVTSLRQIKKDSTIKAVVLRVDSGGGSAIASESILQECKDMPQPVICSMGNYCASGGYYIATGCKRIFALPTTITGSIGVFAVKFDLTGLAKKYGSKCATHYYWTLLGFVSSLPALESPREEQLFSGGRSFV
jgi:protease-4